MNPEQHETVSNAILRAISDDYHEKFEPLYKRSAEITGELSAQASNDIRNALSHLARAQTLDDIEAALMAVEQARWHISIARYDCLLPMIIHRVRFLENYVAALEDVYNQLFVDLRQRLSDIMKKWRSVAEVPSGKRNSVSEIAADREKIDASANELMAVLTTCNELHLYLEVKYSLPTSELSLAARRVRPVKRWLAQHIVWIIFVVILANIVASVVYVLWIDDVVRRFQKIGFNIESSQLPFSVKTAPTILQQSGPGGFFQLPPSYRTPVPN